MQSNKTLPGRRHAAHWYEITIQSCPVCGGGHEFRERRYGPKPTDRAERFHFEEIYDWCNER